MKKLLIILSFLGLIVFELSAQTVRDSNLVQFSGMVLDGTTEELLPIPYANIFVRSEGRGTYTDFKGFFSIVATKGQEVEFSAVGYRTVKFTIPDTLTDNRYSLIQLMTQDTFNLPETVVFPWPSREHFRVEFLAMDVTNEMQEKALENLAQRTLEKGKELVVADGNENADVYLRQQAQNYYHIGQTPPMNIFNPFAWKKFFDAWKKGEFKKKKKKN